MHPYLTGERPIAIAHRGGALEAPENTIEAFAAAVELGYRYLETDAQLTSDGVAVGFHDDIVDRVSNEVGAISEWTWADLQQLNITGETGETGKAGTGRIASVSELLERFPEHRFNIDAKSDEVVAPLVDAITNADAYDRVCIGSFSDARLKRARSLATGHLCTSLGPRAIAAQILRSWGVPLPRPAGDALQIPIAERGVPVFSERLLKASQRDGFAVHLWTINDEAEMARLLDLGVDGIMTDRPTVLKQLFEARGLAL